MITKLTSVKTAIAKVIADLRLQEDDILISDMREWVGEAMEKIGAVQQFERVVSGVNGAPIIKIDCHQAQLPCNLHKLHQVAYSFNCDGPWFPMRKATGSFAAWGCEDCKKCCDKPEMLVKDEVLVDLVVDLYGNIDKTEALEMLNTNENMKTILRNLINTHTVNIDYIRGNTSVNPNWDLQYSIKPGYIMTNVPCGYLKLSYSAIITDEDGYPMVPDNISYLEAIYWYITQKIAFQKYIRGEWNERMYANMRNSWNYYCKQAYAEAMLPNEDEMESIKHTWNKIYPEYHDHSSFYSHTGSIQHIYNANR
mgnify:FL=1|jgi:hypothetical protein|nr:MAG: hypothetical protein [Bacteriophage sp.]